MGTCRHIHEQVNPWTILEVCKTQSAGVSGSVVESVAWVSQSGGGGASASLLAGGTGFTRGAVLEEQGLSLSQSLVQSLR